MLRCRMRDSGSPSVADTQDGGDDEFVCFTDPSTPIVKKFFKKIDATAQLTWLTEAIQQILSSDPEIKRRGMDRADLACWLCCSWLDRQLPEGS